jgi:hypothetical protein
MTNTPTSGFRLPLELLSQIDLYAERLARETGLNVSRTDAVRKLLAVGLEQVAKKRKK